MIKLSISQEGSTVTGVMAGRLDTLASVQLAKDIQPLMDNADKNITLDLAQLEYISSSGLRLLLLLRKKSIAEGGSIVIKHIPDSIHQIFSITGFVNLFDIE